MTQNKPYTTVPLAVVSRNKEGERTFTRYVQGVVTDKAIFEHTEGGDPQTFADLLEGFRLRGLED